MSILISYYKLFNQISIFFFMNQSFKGNFFQVWILYHQMILLDLLSRATSMTLILLASLIKSMNALMKKQMNLSTIFAKYSQPKQALEFLFSNLSKTIPFIVQSIYSWQTSLLQSKAVNFTIKWHHHSSHPNFYMRAKLEKWSGALSQEDMNISKSYLILLKNMEKDGWDKCIHYLLK